MNTIDFVKLGGYPLAQEDLKFLQDSYTNALAALSGFIGDMVIVSGMAEAAGVVDAGWISIGGELIPFEGGAIGGGLFSIEETKTALVFKDGAAKDVLIQRIAKFSVAGAYDYADLKRIGPVKGMWQVGDVKEVDCDDAYIVANFDATGLGINERIGWAICNGNNGTKDRRGRFSVSYDDRNVDPANGIWDAVYHAMGMTGGEKEHQLTVDEMPQHRHDMPNSNDQSGFGKPTTGGAAQEGANLFTNYSGGDEPHENRPPFIVSLFIQKI